MTPVTVPTSTRDIHLPDLTHVPHLCANLAKLPPALLADILNRKDTQQ